MLTKKRKKMKMTYHKDELMTENRNHLYDLSEFDAKIKYKYIFWSITIMNSPRHSHYPSKIYVWTERNVCIKNNYLTKEWVRKEMGTWSLQLLNILLSFMHSFVNRINIYVCTYVYRSRSKPVIEHLVVVTLTHAHMSEINIQHPRENEVKKQLYWEQTQRFTGGKLLS
jgi:hypothetical protein